MKLKNLKVLTESLVSPDIISFAGGAPAKEAYPFEIIGDIAKEVFKPDARGVRISGLWNDHGRSRLKRKLCEIFS